ncbi:peptidoglycan-binding protein [Aliiroseovarius sp.]|uniref:peptidoglycan-binding domain-containing protein n=1 Tax=Aliiroseovarius sp. TaxID=1872442 RepID=UPI00261184C1|nr:peptidoglycan-binding protein [Aliiroseovarius sp.]
MTATTPGPARADKGGLIAGAIVAGAIICASNPKACGGRDRGNREAAAGGGGGDAIAMNRDQRMMVQSGLQNLGFYTGAIDGAIGAGSRNSIRNYQTAVGAPATGALTGVQINDLVALSPRYVRYPVNDTNLFMADIAPDLDRDGVARLQAALNRAGYNAGPVDGVMGGRTGNAIRLYKADNGLPGNPLPTRRLLAHLHGGEAPLPAGVEMAAMQPEGFDTQGYLAGMNSSGEAGLATSLGGGKAAQGKESGGAPVVVAGATTNAPAPPPYRWRWTSNSTFSGPGWARTMPRWTRC